MANVKDAEEFLSLGADDLAKMIESRLDTLPNDQAYLGWDGEKSNASTSRLTKIISAIRNAINSSPTKFRKLICDDLKYCERRNKDGAALSVQLADAILIIFTGIPLPFLMIATYLIKIGFFDEFCKCNTK